MAEVLSKLVRRSLASDPRQLAWLFAGLSVVQFTVYTVADVNHGDHVASAAAALVFSLVVVAIAWRVKKKLWWRRLHNLPIPLDTKSYVNALGVKAEHAHLDVEITFTTAPPATDALVQLAGEGGGATLDDKVAHLVSPKYLTRYREDNFATAKIHTNHRLDRWFRRVVEGLVPMHQHHVMQKISVTHVRD
jgi:hypothetical protein